MNPTYIQDPNNPNGVIQTNASVPINLTQLQKQMAQLTEQGNDFLQQAATIQATIVNIQKQVPTVQTTQITQ